MAQRVRAVYERGHLRLLDDVALDEGEQVSVSIHSEREKIMAALGDLVVTPPPKKKLIRMTMASLRKLSGARFRLICGSAMPSSRSGARGHERVLPRQ